MAELLVDTSVLVGIMRRQVRAFAWLRERRQDTDFYVSAVCVFELVADCRNRSELRKLDRRLGEFKVLNISEPTCELALRWFKTLHLSHSVEFLDCLIGATAKLHGLPICTLNKKDFEPVKGLKVIVPY